jgi:hypothetical protein
VINVPMSDHHGHRLESMLRDQLSDSGHRIHAWIDDHAFLAWSGSRQVAVGLPRPGRK